MCCCSSPHHRAEHKHGGVELRAGARKKEGWPKSNRQRRGVCFTRPHRKEPEVATEDKRAARRAHREPWGRRERRAGSGKTHPPVPGSRSGQRWPDRQDTASPFARTRTTPFCDGARDESADVACHGAAAGAADQRAGEGNKGRITGDSGGFRGDV